MKRAPHIAHYLLAALVAWLPLQVYGDNMPPAGEAEPCATMAMQQQSPHHGHHPVAEIPSPEQDQAAHCSGCTGCGTGCDHCAGCTHAAAAVIPAVTSAHPFVAADTPFGTTAARMSSRSPIPHLRPPRNA